MVEMMQQNANHYIVLNNRNHISVHGIKSVNGFNEELISVVTISEDLLFIEGREMLVEEVNLEKGIVEASGIITGMFYEDNNINNSRKPGLLKGLFIKG